MEVGDLIDKQTSLFEAEIHSKVEEHASKMRSIQSYYSETLSRISAHLSAIGEIELKSKLPGDKNIIFIEQAAQGPLKEMVQKMVNFIGLDSPDLFTGSKARQ